MSRFISNILLLCLMIVVAYIYRDKLEEIIPRAYHNAKEFISPTVPCVDPITYTLGTIDKDFNISEVDFLSALAEAEKVWEEPYGGELFTYEREDEDAMKVNLIYDYRQKVTNRLTAIDANVKATQATYNELKAKFVALQNSYNIAKANFLAYAKEFNQKQKTYNQIVASWNARGGAPKGEYEKLERDRATLNEASKKLQEMQNEVNKFVPELNEMANNLNIMAKELNLNVEKYNAVGETLGDSFEEGVYSSDGITSKIDIFEFRTREKLVRILAHELGHSLGLAHIDDPSAIMYAINQNVTGELSKADIEALNTLCKKAQEK